MKRLLVAGKPYRTTEPVGICRQQIPCNLMVCKIIHSAAFKPGFYMPMQPTRLISVGILAGITAAYEVNRRN